MAGLIPFNKNKSLIGNSFNDFYNMIDDFFSDVMPTRLLNSDTFKVDLQEREKDYIVEAEIPGVEKENVDIQLDDGRLTISVVKEETKDESKGNYIHKERRYGEMKRSIYLQDITSEGISATFDKGLLKIVVPKIEKKDNSVKINIE